MKQKIRELVDRLNTYTKFYDLGTPQISDSDWDDLYFQLVGLEKDTGIYLSDSPTQKINYQVVSELKKVKHNHPMLSLDKTKDWNEFIQYFGSQDVVGMVKLDGLTCSLHYKNGKLIGAETRGNGEEGEDILHNILVLPSVPNKITYKKELIIDGEILCTRKNFEPFKNDYANPRNFAAGSIRLLDSKECANRNLDFYVWNVVVGPCDNLINSFDFIQDLGFKVVPWTSSFDWDAKEFLEDRAKEEGLPMDGLVGRFNDIKYGESLGATSHHSKAAYAFKFEDETFTSYLTDICWTMGRKGTLTPVAVFEEVEIEETKVSRASLHNLSVMKDLLGTPYLGQQVEVFKANLIIPQIAKAEGGTGIEITIPARCPICGGLTKVICEVESEELLCTNPDCEGKLINRLDHFAGKKGLDIKGLSKATLEKLIDWGWVSEPFHIFQLKDYRKEWIKMPGFGEKSVDRVLDSIEEARTATLESFISSLGIPLIGQRMAKELVKHIDSYEDFRKKAKENFDFSQYPNFAEAKTSSIWNFNYEEADRVFDFLNIIQETPSQSTLKSCEGITVVITGSLGVYKNRDALKEEVEKQGGKVVGSISSKTTCLVNNNLESTSSKNKKAKELGIPILSEQDFIQTYLT